MFIEERRNTPHTSHWHNILIDHIDTFAMPGRLHISGREIPITGELMNGDYDIKRGIKRIEDLKQQYIDSQGKWVCYYCIYKNPFEFIEFVKKNDTFREPVDIIKCKLFGVEVYDFSGNLTNRSCAFSFRIYDKITADQITETIKDLKVR